jgi:hypothetical protein
MLTRRSSVLRPGITPKPGQRFTGERRPVSLTRQVNDRGWQVTEAYRLVDDRRRLQTRGRDDEERYPDLRSVEALAMVKQTVLAQAFAMIRGHDDQCLFEDTATLQFVEQNTKLLVEVYKTVVIRIASQRDTEPRQLCLVKNVPKIINGPVLVPRRGVCLETMWRSFRQPVGLMSVHKIQEGKERAIGFSSMGLPVEKCTADRRGILSQMDYKPANHEVSKRIKWDDVKYVDRLSNHRGDLFNHDRRPERRQLLQVVVFIMSEAAGQS